MVENDTNQPGEGNSIAAEAIPSVSIEDVVQSCAAACKNFGPIPLKGKIEVIQKLSEVVAEFEESSRGSWNRERSDIGTRKAFILDEVRGIKSGEDEDSDLTSEDDRSTVKKLTDLASLMGYDYGVDKPIRFVAAIFENALDVIQNNFESYEDLISYKTLRRKVSTTPTSIRRKYWLRFQ